MYSPSNLIQGGLPVSKIISAKEAAKFLGITENTLYRLANAGEIPGRRIGNQWRFDTDKLKGLFGFDKGDSPPQVGGAGRNKKKSRGKKK